MAGESINTSPSRPTSYAWLVVALLWVVALLNYLDRLMITTMRDPIRAEIPMSEAQFGLLTAVFLWTYAATSPLGGFLADRVGRRGVIFASLIFWSVATCATGMATSLHQLLLARALMGVSEACYIPAALALIADYHPGSTRSLATGLHMAGIYTGAALGGVGGYVAESFGWRFGFRIFGGVGLAYGLFLLFVLHDAPRTADRDNHTSRSRTALWPAITGLFSRAGFWILLAVNLLVGMVNWAIYGWMPTFLKGRFHLGLGAAGLSATAYIQVASFGGVLAAGYLADRWSRTNRRARAITPAIGYVLAGPCLIAAASTHLFPLAIAGLIVFGLGRGAFDANQMPLLREIVPERYSATGYGFLNLISTAVGGVMIYVGGALLDAHVELNTIFQFAGVALLLAGVFLFLVLRRGES
ncbi:MAG TPA: MFS transporter [Tepidisphaeraceae bacterium]|jgi:MFS family permease|nr:MFS transporter [Tepidisphaeraceae bacterium]